MDLKIDWSPEAVEDLESIADYIGHVFGQTGQETAPVMGGIKWV
jgi:hypothetical protein